MARAGAATRTPGQLFALVFGIVYVLVGILGFFLGGGGTLILFGVNPLHNIVHLVVGALFLYGSTSAAMAKTINLTVGIVYILVGLLGFTGILSTGGLININNNGADIGLHLVTGALALYFGTAGAGRAVTA